MFKYETNLIRWTSPDKAFVVVGIVQVPPDPNVVGWYLEALQLGSSHSQVMKLGQQLAIQVTQVVATNESGVTSSECNVK